MEEFERKYNFPGVVGAINGTHIRIIPPKTDPAAYVNRKYFHSIVAQVITKNTKIVLNNICNNFRNVMFLYSNSTVMIFRLFVITDLSSFIATLERLDVFMMLECCKSQI